MEGLWELGCENHCVSLQVAILCQFLREVDYKTAFKALQEQNR